MKLLTSTNKYIGLKLIKEFQPRNMINKIVEIFVDLFANEIKYWIAYEIKMLFQLIVISYDLILKKFEN